MKTLLMPILTHPGHTIGLGSVSRTKIPWRVLSLALCQGLQVEHKATQSKNDAHWCQSQWTKRWTPKFNVAGWHQVNPLRWWERIWDYGGEHEMMGETWDDGWEHEMMGRKTINDDEEKERKKKRMMWSKSTIMWIQVHMPLLLWETWSSHHFILCFLPLPSLFVSAFYLPLHLFTGLTWCHPTMLNFGVQRSVYWLWCQ